MKLTRNQIMLIAGVAILVVVYFMFFRKKPSGQKTTTPPAKGADESKYSSIPGTEPFNETFMQPVSTKAARMSMMDAITV